MPDPNGTDAAPVDDIRVRAIEELVAPHDLCRDLPAPPPVTRLVVETRRAIHQVLAGEDPRLVVLVGPCSIHDAGAAIEYARRLAGLARELSGALLVLMRVYFEKPRTTLGWKGLINDPGLDDSFRINDGLRLARRILLQVNELGLPAGTEFLDMITPQYIADLVSCGAIGARTTESQVHRQLASGLSCPVGFKNGTDGDIAIAVDAVRAAAAPHHFMGVTKRGHSAIVHTTGNRDCFIILRGGREPNYDGRSVDATSAALERAGLAPRVMIDCSHANSQRQPARQIEIVGDIARRVAAGERRIVGVMLESHLQAGRQDLTPGQPLAYGVSITDACVGWDETAAALRELAAARHT
jgi:3-deoxy-7-phosphoheptulonate synthase